jgi:hypothetical protein
MARHKMVNGEKIPLTQDEEDARDAEEAKWESEKAKRAFSALREERGMKLIETDFVVTRAVEAGTDVPDDWKTYREQLRQLPNGLTDETVLQDISWPTKPS